MYTLYGHEGDCAAATFSPSGDYFTSGGSDGVVMTWKSNLNEFEQELIDDFGGKTSMILKKDYVPDQNQKKAAVKPVQSSMTP